MNLTRLEFDVLAALHDHRGKRRTREQLYNTVYGATMRMPNIKVMNVVVCKIRKKLAASGAPRCIRTEWGEGYTLLVDDDGPHIA